MLQRGRRLTVARSHLESRPGFEELSPEVGSLDEEVLDSMLTDDPDRAMSLLADAARATDPRLRQLARTLAARVAVDVARRGRVRSHGLGTMASRPFRPDGGDLDVDASLDALVERAGGLGLDTERMRQREWTRPTTALCLLIDSSGSMRGSSLATAAVGAAAVALRAPTRHAVASFAGHVLVIKDIGAEKPPERVVDDVLSLRGKGTTDVAAALTEAAAQLAATNASRKVTLLLSDCRANTPGDPVAAATSLDELVIVAPDGDDAQARLLASAAGARVAAVSGPSEIPEVLAELLG